MKKTLAAALAATMMIATTSQAFATDYGAPVKPAVQTKLSKGKGFDKFALGLAIGATLVGAAIVANRAHADQRSHRGDGDYNRVAYDRGEGMCRVWRADCRKGIESGCYKYERRC